MQELEIKTLFSLRKNNSWNCNHMAVSCLHQLWVTVIVFHEFSGQGPDFVEWANCFPLCCPSSKFPSGLYQTVFTANNCCLLYILTLQGPTLSKHTAAMALLAGLYSCVSQLGTITQSNGNRELGLALIPIGVVCTVSRSLPPTPSHPKLTSQQKIFRALILGYGMVVFLFSTGFLDLKAHFSFFHSLSKVTSSGLGEVNWSQCHI